MNENLEKVIDTKEKQIDYCISYKEELEPVGKIRYLDTGEILKYYSEFELLKKYTETMEYLGYGRIIRNGISNQT